ncbi:MAG: gamma-glutamyltransferase [Gammaproteobacteria bacterium]|nr:gamma-glutamyltransferase [Gammaproteobacteria bacterium]
MYQVAVSICRPAPPLWFRLSAPHARDLQSCLLEWLERIYRTESTPPLFADTMQPGGLLQPGDVFRNPGLADALQSPAAEGDASFYKGNLAARGIGSVKPATPAPLVC